MGVACSEGATRAWDPELSPTVLTLEVSQGSKGGGWPDRVPDRAAVGIQGWGHSN